MSRWAWCWLLLVSCVPAASPESLACYQSCARGKDSCILAASTAAKIQACDESGARCSAGCP